MELLKFFIQSTFLVRKISQTYERTEHRQKVKIKKQISLKGCLREVFIRKQAWLVSFCHKDSMYKHQLCTFRIYCFFLTIVILAQIPNNQGTLFWCFVKTFLILISAESTTEYYLVLQIHGHNGGQHRNLIRAGI